MKKCLSFFVLLVSLSVSCLFAQNSAAKANRNTAMRCFNLAESCLLNGDWENSLRQAELGLAYDDSISDLIYIKAAAQSKLDYKRADVLSIISQAFEKNEWLGYTKNGARILYADLLCDTGSYEASLEVLNQEPFIFSADAEFIRIKNYYRMGTADSLEKAREKVNSSRKVYPEDSRFPKLFFMFEAVYKCVSELYNLEYYVSENVSTIANAYIPTLPDYRNSDEDFEIYAAWFAPPEVQVRLIEAIAAKSKEKNPLLVIAQKKLGLISDEAAFTAFFDSINNAAPQILLDMFISLITDDDVKHMIIEKLTNFDGTIYVDSNFDLQSELSIKYSLGRPKYVNYDQNNDGIKEMAAVCDFGAPVSVYFINDGTEMIYDVFPKVQRVTFLNDNYVFNFQDDDYTYAPFEMNLDGFVKSLGYDFYVPYISDELSIPTPAELVRKSSTVELPIAERQNAKIVYSTFAGNLVFARFYENDVNYAYCDFSKGLPFIRYADYDNDSVFETTETFDSLPDGVALSAEDATVLTNIFSNIVDGSSVYLKKVQIDHNSNTFYEYSEEYIPGGGKIVSWDNDDNGILDSQYITYPAEDGKPVVEESIFYGSNGLPVVSLYTLDELPVKMVYGDNEVMVYAGNAQNFYWIDQKENLEIEEKIIEFAQKGITQGTIDLFEYKEQRFSVIKIGKDLFAKRVD